MKIQQLKVGFVLALVLSFSLGSVSAQIVWNGNAGNGLWADGGNWDGGSAPANSDFNGRARFDLLTPTTVTVPSGRDARQIIFDTAGWTISGNFFRLTDISSSGLGTNTFNGGDFEIRNGSNPTWLVDTGNTLDLQSSFSARDQAVSVQGGGTLLIANDIGGFGGPSFTIFDVDVVINDDTPFSTTSGTTFIDDLDGSLTLSTTVASAQNQITDGDIASNLFSSFDVFDNGNGTVTITAIPEPSSVALLGLGSIAFAAIRRRMARSSNC